ncbi:hypothetical protein M758_3G139900 [Ceratodon purpureus]|nr:hypothetical protein M758_3G139900 [Ceratodon purpureus]
MCKADVKDSRIMDKYAQAVTNLFRSWVSRTLPCHVESMSNVYTKPGLCT